MPPLVYFTSYSVTLRTDGGWKTPKSHQETLKTLGTICIFFLKLSFSQDGRCKSSTSTTQFFRCRHPTAMSWRSTVRPTRLPLSETLSGARGRKKLRGGFFRLGFCFYRGKGHIPGNITSAATGITSGWIVNDFTLREKAARAKGEDVWPAWVARKGRLRLEKEWRGGWSTFFKDSTGFVSLLARLSPEHREWRWC